ncbi:uncharacterized protein LOC122506341 [Leptopilina heterotoma]|uniref:uncharacterized protein LOC122506341 n=1 Tax=Leptopilina heterotoma TaxID=63436 RepID=UPI001CAA113E|nr:uncharacterized protein LOC122506341 [Leptopilina heterotoma]
MSTSRNTNTDSEQSSIRRHFPLPKLDLPTFSGGYEEWLGFKDTFSAIIHNEPNIPNVQKFRYLKSYLKDNAARVVENIEISESGYVAAWKLLDERFNNKRIIIQTHMTALFELPVPSRESPSCLRNFLDSILRHTRALNVLGQPTEKWDTPLICLLTNKLDKDSRREWERSVKGSEMPTFDSLTAFLQEKCQILETLNPVANNVNKNNLKGNNKPQINHDKRIISILPKITGHIPTCPINKETLKIPHYLKLADPEFHLPKTVDILIGAELFYELLGNSKISLAMPHTSLQSSRLGWIVIEKMNENKFIQSIKCNLVRDPILLQLNKFWEIKEGKSIKHITKEEAESEQHFNQNTQRDNEGKYIVRLPFNQRKNELGDSYEIARKRFFMLERRLQKNIKLKEQYDQFIREYQELEHLEPTYSGRDEGYYIPHQAVISEDDFIKLFRVVFDGSSKTTSGTSLNDILMVGATIQDGLVTLLIRFRQHPIAFSADIQKMYRQFWIHEDDRKYQKILWRYDSDSPLRTFQLKTVTYGTSAAPFLATRCLQELAANEGDDFPDAAQILENDFYVDDMLSGADSIEKAQQLCHDIIRLTSKGGLSLRKWKSNVPEIIEGISSSARSVEPTLTLNAESISKTLGVKWDSKKDALLFEVADQQEVPITSKRVMLSQIAKLYDPLGLVAPVVTYAKIRMQDLWKIGQSWDDPVPPEILDPYNAYREQLQLINEWELPRAARIMDAEDTQIHGFADASEKAYGACVYIRSSKGNNHQCILLYAKSRVAPVKIVTLPRLELCAAVLLTTVLKTVKESLKCKVDQVRLWSDSTIVLNWINSPPHKFNTFVANRIAEIHGSTSADMWGHVSSGDNPADFISRGQMPADFINNQMWKEGPKWLSQSEEFWPNYTLEQFDPPEQKKTSC